MTIRTENNNASNLLPDMVGGSWWGWGTTLPFRANIIHDLSGLLFRFSDSRTSSVVINSFSILVGKRYVPCASKSLVVWPSILHFLLLTLLAISLITMSWTWASSLIPNLSILYSRSLSFSNESAGMAFVTTDFSSSFSWFFDPSYERHHRLGFHSQWKLTQRPLLPLMRD